MSTGASSFVHQYRDVQSGLRHGTHRPEHCLHSILAMQFLHHDRRAWPLSIWGVMQFDTDLLVLLQSLPNRKELIGSITLLCMLYETEGFTTAHVHALELILSWNDLCSHGRMWSSRSRTALYTLICTRNSRRTRHDRPYECLVYKACLEVHVPVHPICMARIRRQRASDLRKPAPVG